MHERYLKLLDKQFENKLITVSFYYLKQNKGNEKILKNQQGKLNKIHNIEQMIVEQKSLSQ